MQQYAATANALHTKTRFYSAMVVYGLLTYEEWEGIYSEQRVDGQI